MNISFAERVAIVTGAGAGLGRSYALELAKRGARVIVNDIPTKGDRSESAEEAVTEIQAAGGHAIAFAGDVTDYNAMQAMVSQAIDAWGRVDILINNAGILNANTFAKMELSNFQKMMDVHLMGSVHCTKAVWDFMRKQEYGRILMTTSAAGLYGGFGYTHYSCAKMALIGLMNSLSLEGQKFDIRVNTIAPGAATSMGDAILSPEIKDRFTLESVTAGALALCTENAPSRNLLSAAAGTYGLVNMFETEGVTLPKGEQTLEAVVDNWDKIADTSRQSQIFDAHQYVEKIVSRAQDDE